MQFCTLGIIVDHEAFASKIIAVRDFLTDDRDGYGTMAAHVACGSSFVTDGPNGGVVTIPVGVILKCQDDQ